VNVPAQPPSGLRVTRLGKRLYERNSLTPLGKHGPSTYYLVYGSSEEQPTPHEDVEGTDFAALRAGFVSVTPVNYEHGHDNPADITGWAQRLITAAKSYLPQMH
jgi:5'-nucleotidase